MCLLDVHTLNWMFYAELQQIICAFSGPATCHLSIAVIVIMTSHNSVISCCSSSDIDEHKTSAADGPPPIQQKKSTTCNKPLLEKRRRARINKSLDQLKVLLFGDNVSLATAAARQADSAAGGGGAIAGADRAGATLNCAKLEKADILELAVRHLTVIHSQQQHLTASGDRFQAGFVECIAEVQRFMSSPGMTSQPSILPALVTHLAATLRRHRCPATDDNNCRRMSTSRMPLQDCQIGSNVDSISDCLQLDDDQKLDCYTAQLASQSPVYDKDEAEWLAGGSESLAETPIGCYQLSINRRPKFPTLLPSNDGVRRLSMAADENSQPEPVWRPW